MKKILLFIAFIVFSNISSAQTYTFGTYPDCQLPPGFIVGQGAQVGPYDNPSNGCGPETANFADDCGIITPAIGGKNPASILFPPQVFSGGSMIVCFDIYAFEANLKCVNNLVLPCSGEGITVVAYIVDATYTSTTAPDATQYYGISERRIVIQNNRNCVDVNFNNPANPYSPTGQYRVFLDFTTEDNCLQLGIR